MENIILQVRNWKRKKEGRAAICLLLEKKNNSTVAVAGGVEGKREDMEIILKELARQDVYFKMMMLKILLES